MLKRSLHVTVQAEKQALRVKLRRAGGSAADVAISTPAAAEQEQQQKQQQPQQPQPQAQQQQHQQDAQSRAAPLHAAAQPDMGGLTPTDSVSSEHRGAEAAGAAESADSIAEVEPASATAIVHGDSGAGDAPEQQQQHCSWRIAAAVAAAAASARAAASDAAAAGPAVAVLQQLLPWRVTGQHPEAAGAAEPTSQALMASMSADEAVRWATQQHAATLSAIQRTLEQLAEEKHSCLAALEAQQVRELPQPCHLNNLATARGAFTASPAAEPCGPVQETKRCCALHRQNL